MYTKPFPAVFHSLSPGTSEELIFRGCLEASPGTSEELIFRGCCPAAEAVADFSAGLGCGIDACAGLEIDSVTDDRRGCPVPSDGVVACGAPNPTTGAACWMVPEAVGPFWWVPSGSGEGCGCVWLPEPMWEIASGSWEACGCKWVPEPMRDPVSTFVAPVEVMTEPCCRLLVVTVVVWCPEIGRAHV